MKELSERDKALIVDDIPETNLVLFCPGLQGRGATLIDRSQSANHGTISVATWVRLPSGLMVLSFAGADKVDHGDDTSLQITGSLTIEVWVKFNAASMGQHKSIIEYLLGTGYEMLKHNSNVIRFYRAGGVEGVSQLTGTVAMVVNTWTHLALVYDNTLATGYIYVNAALDVSGALTVAPTFGVGSLVLGARAGTSLFLNGYLGRPRIYSRALSITELARHRTRERHLFGV